MTDRDFIDGRAVTVAELRNLLQVAASLLDGAGSPFADPNLRMSWGRRRRDVLDRVREMGLS